MEKLSHAYIVSSASESVSREKAIELVCKMLCSGTGKSPAVSAPTAAR